MRARERAHQERATGTQEAPQGPRQAGATVREIVEQERARGIDDHQTAGLLRASKIDPPPGYYCWSVVAIREGIFGTEAATPR